MNPVAQLLVVVAGLLLIGALGEFIFARTGIPDVVWLVLARIFAGPVFEIVSPQVLEPVVPFFGAIALTIILSGGAYRLRLTEVAAVAPPCAFVVPRGISFFPWLDLRLFLDADRAAVCQARNPFVLVNCRCHCRGQLRIDIDADACRRKGECTSLASS
jgi:hypothetical protein